MSTHYIYRVVPHGEPAAGWSDEDDERVADYEGPCDLVGLVAEVIADEAGGDGDCFTEERELTRTEHASAREASAALCEMIAGKRPMVAALRKDP